MSPWRRAWKGMGWWGWLSLVLVLIWLATFIFQYRSGL